jgi:ABC-type multidrug transport system ATPase subunit
MADENDVNDTNETASPSEPPPASVASPSDEPKAPFSEPGAPGSGAVKKKAEPKTKIDRDAPPAVELRGVSKHFGEKKAVNEVTFSVPTGSVFGLIGPNGAGKTTTFSMMAGYLEPSAGDLFVLDHRPTALAALRGKLGVLPQDALLPSNEKVGEFLIYLARLQGMEKTEAEKNARDVLAEVEGTEWWGTKCNTLSHGQQKRVGIAQALLGNPRVVLLDEPTAGLDPRVAYGVRQIIKARKGRCTMIVSSHNLNELEEVCDHAAILDHGQLVAVGSIADLTASSEEVRFDLGKGPIPEAEIRALPGVTQVTWDKPARELAVRYDRQSGDAEEMIRRVLVVLLEKGARISGVAKGRGLEQRVMELTD